VIVRRFVLFILPAILPAALSATLLAQEAAPRTATPAADAQASPPSFTTEVEQVVVDVVVTDKKGTPVSGLTRDDMIVTEDGIPQKIVSFDAIALPDQPSPQAPPPPIVSTNSSPDERRVRTFVIVFDDMHMTPWRARDAKAAVASFLERGVREGDRVSLLSTAGEAWWTTRMVEGKDQLIDILQRLDGRYIPDRSMDQLTDWEAMRIHVYHDPRVTAQVVRRFQVYGVSMPTADSRDNLYGTGEDPFVSARASEVYFAACTRNRATLGVLERALNGLVGGPGRKSVILVSEGFIEDPNLDEFKRVEAAARRANAAIYFVNAKGLEALPPGFGAEFGAPLPSQDVGFAMSSTVQAAAGAEGLAADSGGFSVRNTNDLASGIQRIADETRVYYLLGYVPGNTARDGRFREIEVKLKSGKGLKVRARKGYYAPSAEGATALEERPEVDRVMQATLDAPWMRDDIPLRMTDYIGEEHLPGRARVTIVADVDIRGFEFEEKDGRDVAEFDLLLVVAHRESGDFSQYDQGVTLRLRPSTHERLSWLWFPIQREFELQPGDHQAKLIVRETSTGKVGSVVHEFRVPPLDRFRVSTPILSDTGSPPSSGELPRPEPVARREFPAGAQMLCQFDVFGAARDATGMPRVTNGYEIRRTDGPLLGRQPQSDIVPTSLGALTRLFGFSLDHAEPGDYLIHLTFKDEVSGETLSLEEPFTVIPPLPIPKPDATAAAREGG
jgi:VWFA-related protein